MKEDDASWPEPDRVGRQELEVVIGNEHISFCTSKIGAPSAAPLLGGRLLFVLCPPPSFQRLRCTHDDISLQHGVALEAHALAPSQTAPTCRARRLAAGCAAEQGPRGPACVLLPRPGGPKQPTLRLPAAPRSPESQRGSAAPQRCFPSLAPPPTAISGPEMLCVLTNRAPLQDQADLGDAPHTTSMKRLTAGVKVG